MTAGCIEVNLGKLLMLSGTASIFSVDNCFEHLLRMQEEIEKNGFVQGTIHRYLIVAKK